MRLVSRSECSQHQRNCLKCDLIFGRNSKAGGLFFKTKDDEKRRTIDES